MDHTVENSRASLTSSLHSHISCLLLGLFFSNLWLPGREVHCLFHVEYLCSSSLLLLLLLLFVFSNKSLGFPTAPAPCARRYHLHSLRCLSFPLPSPATLSSHSFLPSYPCSTPLSLINSISPFHSSSLVSCLLQV